MILQLQEMVWSQRSELWYNFATEELQQSDKKKKENVLSKLPTLISTSTACCRLGFMISKTSCAGAGWWMTCKDLDYWDGKNPGRACHFGAIFGRTAGDSQRDSLVWSGLTVCSPTTSALPDNSAWRAQMSVHKQTDTRAGERMCGISTQRMMQSDISWEISEHKQRSGYSDTF